MDGSTIAAVLGAVGVGGAVQAGIGYLKDRKKNDSDAERTDVDTKLAYLNTVIERLDGEAKRSLSERDRLAGELTTEQQRSSDLRKRVRELEDEIDGVRRAARDTQNRCDDLQTKCDQLAAKIRVLGSEEGASG